MFTMFSNVVVAYDGSAGARKALQVATELGVAPDKLPELYTSPLQWTAEALGAVAAKPDNKKLAAR